MRTTFGGPAVLMLGLLAVHDAHGQSQGAAALWLDAKEIEPWNSAGQEIPAAPKVQDVANPRCREQARPPQIDEDERVQDRGWDLVGAYQGGWHIVVVRGTASYDGMCRPMHYQDFVFVRGVFAGTLSPTPMNSRTDGAIGRIWLPGPKELIAEYTRYAGSDALCCPSRSTRVTFEVTGDPPVVRAAAASTSPTGK